jgi:hypothetical protein
MNCVVREDAQNQWSFLPRVRFQGTDDSNYYLQDLYKSPFLIKVHQPNQQAGISIIDQSKEMFESLH